MENYEQKYKDALVRAMRKWRSGLMTREELEELFPELADSEDEKIKNTLIDLFKNRLMYYGTEKLQDLKVDDIVSWLEKQGEQKLEIPKFRIGDFVKDANYHGEPIYEIVGMDNECYICDYRGNKSMGDKSVMHFTFDNPYLRLVEQKHVEWSEEDEKHMQSVISSIEMCKAEYPNATTAVNAYNSDIDWLKSLKRKNIKK